MTAADCNFFIFEKHPLLPLLYPLITSPKINAKWAAFDSTPFLVGVEI